MRPSDELAINKRIVRELEVSVMTLRFLVFLIIWEVLPYCESRYWKKTRFMRKTHEFICGEPIKLRPFYIFKWKFRYAFEDIFVYSQKINLAPEFKKDDKCVLKNVDKNQ